MADVQRQINGLKRERDILKRKYESLREKVKDFVSAITWFPTQLREFIAGLCKREQEQQWQAPTHKKSYDRGQSKYQATIIPAKKNYCGLRADVTHFYLSIGITLSNSSIKSGLMPCSTA
jgi:hypothetical protein